MAGSDTAAASNGNVIRRLQTAELEVGVTEAVQKHITRYVVPTPPVSQRRLDFEHKRPRWLREMAAEAMGVFFYVYCGVISTACFFLNDAEPIYGSLFQIGWAYAFGIAFAIICCASTSGGHFNPAITLVMAYWNGFPWKKVPYYIFAQVFGSFLAGLMVVGQYHPQLSALAATFKANGLSLNSTGGPGAILCSFPASTQTNYGYLFLIEFFCDTFLGLVIWSCLDHSNPFISPASAPVMIGIAYAVMVWGLADVTISTNLARDLGTRIVAAIFYGSDAFTKYAGISILVNIPATFLATCIYEVILRDSMVNIAHGHAKHEGGEDGLMRHLTKTGTLDEHVENPSRHNDYREKDIV